MEVNLNDLKDLIKNLRFTENPPPVQKPFVAAPQVEKAEKIEPIITPIPLEKPHFEPKPVEIKVAKEEPIPEPISAKKVEEQPVESPAYFEPKKSWWENFREQNPDLEKFVGENLISKIGVLILVLGISYFVKYAIDKDWINETARVGIGILCGAIVMGFAHRLRANYKAFSSVLVAGAISIFYFTIGIAFHQYHLFNQTVAFIIMVVITAFSVFISVSYDRMELAVLSLIGGFAVPFMVSTGDGNYQVLFTYITILDAGILAIAYQKRWSLVNILAFAFTAFLYAGWLGTKVVGSPQAPYFGAFVFATIFFLTFTLVNIINNLREKGVFTSPELAVMISNTFLYFSAGIIILSHFHPELKGLFTLVLALFNFSCAWLLYKKFGLDKNAIYLLIGLTLTFVTLAIPIQFNGNYITLFWAAEAVLLVWLSQRSQIVQFRFASIIVYALMIISLLLDWKNVYGGNATTVNLLLNAGFISGIFTTFSFIATSFMLKNENENHILAGITLNSGNYKRNVEILALIVLYFTGILEVIFQAKQHFTSSFSAASLSVAYHLVFCAKFIFFYQRTKYPLKYKISVILSLLNIVLYVIFFSSIPLEELKEQLRLANSSNVAFFLHYVNLICVIYFGWVIYKDCQTDDSLSLANSKWFIWFAAFAIIYVASNEVMLHGLSFLTEPVAVKDNKSAALAFEMYNKAQTQLVKVEFPILWGLLAFVFLTIGIKKQSRALRIIALTLLGITTVKLFAYDISNVSETGKIIAFILLGVMILVMSFAYQKIKTIVLSNDKNHDSENETT